MMKAKLSDAVLQALAAADRSPGWNNRSRDVQRFELASIYGNAACTLYVVPFRCWAYRRQERAAADYWRHHGGAPGGTAA